MNVRTLTVASAAMLAAGTLAAGWQLSPSAAAETERTWQKTSALWDVIGVGPHERSIELAYRDSGCERNPAATVHESAKSVTIQVSQEALVRRPTVVCVYSPVVGSLRVSLARPLAGRVILGRPRYPPYDTPQLPFGRDRTKMPSLIGFAPTDAEQVLTIYEAQAKIRFAPKSHGRPRVLAQQPRPGTPLPPDHTVRIRVSR
jgi:hypothetical protein